MQLKYGRAIDISMVIMIILLEPTKPMNFFNHLKGSDDFCMNLTLIEMHCHVSYLHPLSLRKKKESPADVSQQISIASTAPLSFLPLPRGYLHCLEVFSSKSSTSSRSCHHLEDHSLPFSSVSSLASLQSPSASGLHLWISPAQARKYHHFKQIRKIRREPKQKNKKIISKCKSCRNI